MTVNEGEAFVAGVNAETAKELLEAAEKAGLDASVVRVAAGDDGFIVPEELATKPKPKPEPKGPSKATDKK